MRLLTIPVDLATSGHCQARISAFNLHPKTINYGNKRPIFLVLKTRRNKYIFSKTEFHVLILGIDKAGKTTLLEKLKSVYSKLEGLPPDRIVPTVGLNIGRIEVSNTKLVFWDLGGQLGLRSIWEKYYEEAHAVIFVIDAACPSRFEDSKSALEKVLRHEDLQGAPILILANKQDLSEALSAEELARYLDLKKLDERVYMFEAASAFDGLGIKEGVEWLVEVMERSKRTETLRNRASITGQN
ncbi:hypothetical protein V6N13_108587 [Hibiscus sabdariffa]